MRKKNYPVPEAYRSPRVSEYRMRATDRQYDSSRHRQDYLTTSSYSVQDLHHAGLYGEDVAVDPTPEVAQQKGLTARKKEQQMEYSGSASNLSRPRQQTEEVRRSQFNYEPKERPIIHEKATRDRSHRNIEINLNFDKGKLTTQDISQLLTSKTLQFEHLNGEYMRDRARWQIQRKRLRTQVIKHQQEIERLSETVHTLKLKLGNQDELYRVMTPTSEDRRKNWSTEEHSRSIRSLSRRHDDDEQKQKLRDIQERTRRLSEMEKQERMTAEELMVIIQKLREENANFKKRYSKLGLTENSTQTQTQSKSHLTTQQDTRKDITRQIDHNESLQQLRLQNQKLEKDVLSLTYEVSNLLSDKTSYMQELQSVKAELVESRSIAKAEMEKLMVDINNLADLLVEKEIENDEVAPYKEKANQLQKINQELRLTLTGYEKLESIKAGERVGLQIQIDQLQRDLKQALMEKSEKITIIEQLKLKNKQITQQLNEQAHKLNRKQQINEIMKQYEHSQQLIKQLNEQTRRLNQQLKVVGSELQLNNGLNIELKLQNEFLQKRIQESQLQATNLQKNLIESLNNQISQIKQQVDKLKVEHNIQAKSKQNELKELKKQITESRDKYKDLDFLKQNLESELKAAKQKIMKYQQTIQQNSKRFVKLSNKPSIAEYEIQTDKLSFAHSEQQTEIIALDQAHNQMQTENTQPEQINADMQTVSSEIRKVETQTQFVATKPFHSQTQGVVTKPCESQTQNAQFTHVQANTQKVPMNHVDVQTETVWISEKNIGPRGQDSFEQVKLKVQYNVNIEEQHQNQSEQSQQTAEFAQIHNSLLQENQKLTNLIDQLQSELKLQRARKDELIAEKVRLEQLMLERANKHQQQLKVMLGANQKISQNMLEVAHRNSELQAQIQRIKVEHESSSGSLLKVHSNIKSNQQIQEFKQSKDETPKSKQQTPNLFHIPEESQQQSAKDSNLVVSRLQSLLSEQQTHPVHQSNSSKNIQANNMVQTINQLSQLLPDHNHNVQPMQNLSGSGFVKKSYAQDESQEGNVNTSQDHSFQFKSSVPSLKSDDVKILTRGTEFKAMFQSKLEEAKGQSKFGKDDCLVKAVTEFLKNLYEYPNTDYFMELAKKLYTEIRIYERHTQQKMAALEKAIASYIKKANAVFVYPATDPVIEDKPKTEPLDKGKGQAHSLDKLKELIMSSDVNCKIEITQQSEKVAMSAPVSQLSAKPSDQHIVSLVTIEPSHKSFEQNKEQQQKQQQQKITDVIIEEKGIQNLIKFEQKFEQKHEEQLRQGDFMIQQTEPMKQLELLMDQHEVSHTPLRKADSLQKSPESSKISKASSHKTVNSLKPTITQHRSPASKKVQADKGTPALKSTQMSPTSKFGSPLKGQVEKPKPKELTKVTPVKKNTKK